MNNNHCATLLYKFLYLTLNCLILSTSERPCRHLNGLVDIWTALTTSRRPWRQSQLSDHAADLTTILDGPQRFWTPTRTP